MVGFERVAALDQIADALQDDERRVPFIQVPHGGRRAHRLERTDTANAENDFLLDACLAVAPVEAGGQLAVPRRVFREIRIEQEQLHAAEPDPPHRHQHAAVSKRNGDNAGLPVRGHRGLHRRLRPGELLV
jgi:hypothetical protein